MGFGKVTKASYQVQFKAAFKSSCAFGVPKGEKLMRAMRFLLKELNEESGGKFSDFRYVDTLRTLDERLLKFLYAVLELDLFHM